MLRIAPHLPLLATLALLTGFLLVAAPDTIRQDTWLALVSGREIADHGLPQIDHLTVLAAGRRWIDQQWLGQLIFYRLSELGGIKAVAVGGMAAAAVAYGVAIHASIKRGGHPTLVTLFTIAAIASAPWALEVRTQELVFPFFALILVLFLQDERAERARTLLVVPLLCLWANIHGSAVLAAAITVLYGLTVVGWSQPRRHGLVRAMPYLASPVTLLASPYGFSVLRYYHTLLIDPPFAHLDIEWQASRPSAITAVFFAVLAVTAVAIITRFRRFTPFELGVLALTSAVGLFALRNIVWFALAVLPILPRVLRPVRGAFAGRAPGIMAAVAAIALAGVYGVATALPQSYYAGKVISTKAVPAAAVGVETSRGLVFADDRHADWLLWYVPVARGRVAYDSRLEILTRPEIERIVAVTGMHPGFTRALDRFSIVITDLRHARGLVKTGWGRIVYSDPTTSIVKRIALGEFRAGAKT